MTVYQEVTFTEETNWNADSVMVSSLRSWRGGLDEGEGSGGDLSPLPFVTFSLFLSLSSAKIQYGAQTDYAG